MRTFADITKDREDGAWYRLLVEMLVSQTIAVANYKKHEFRDRSDVSAMIFHVAGYPMLNRPLRAGPDTPDAQSEATSRIMYLLDVPDEQRDATDSAVNSGPVSSTSGSP